jgi:DNA helicase-2/ATP-dependent DNA helicase PcrA
MEARVERLFQGLDDGQRAAVAVDAEPLCIVAGAGSGKTRVLTSRIARRVLDGSADPGHVLALTFTRKAAGELRRRLGGLGVRDSVAAGTFHAVAYAQLRRRWADRSEREPTLLTSKVRVLGPLMRGRPGVTPALQAMDVASEIEWAKARMVGPDDFEAAAAAAGRKPPATPAFIAALFQRYEDEKRRKGLVDFDDLLLACAQALETDSEFAASQRWRFRHLFVDEFQDVNPVQHRLLTGWLGERLDLCVVGDPNQAIYSWNGADPAFLTGFARRWPTAQVVRLDSNYRSSPQILTVANTVLADGGGSAPTSLHAAKPDGPLPSVRSYESDVAEARAVAHALRKAHRPGTAWSHLAVLVRTNAQAVLFEESLRRASIPYRVRGGGAFLDQPEVKAALAMLVRGPAGVPFVSRVTDLETSLLVGGENGPVANDAAGSEARIASLEALIRLGREYADVDPSPSGAGFTTWLQATVRAEEPGDGADVVEIATFHRAKGLEWPVVFVAGLERGLVPIGHATTPEAHDEERRLLYVALTRAQREVHCSWAQRRTFGTRSVPRGPSPWITTIEAACAAIERGGSTADGAEWRRRVAAEAERLRPQPSAAGPKGGDRKVVGADADPVVFDALKAWRSAMAKAAQVPAYVIFHDSTLAAVAEAKPDTPAKLLQLPGLGPVKAARYGEALLAVVAEHRASA